MHRSTVVVAIAALALATAGGTTATAGQAATTPLPGGSIALSGADAGTFAIPPGMVKLWTADRAGGGTQTRYQQMVGAARVLGGQLTVLADKSGRTTAVVGAYFPGLKAKNSASVSAAGARGIAAKRVGAAGEWSSALRIDPSDGRLFHQVVTQRADQRWVQWVDATSGAVKKQYDAVAHGDGTGVKGDPKTFSTIQVGSTFLRSADGRQETYDAGNMQVRGTIMTDSDDHWNFNKPKFLSPSQAPGVDAHYYTAVVDDFYADVFGRNSVDDKGMPLISTVHFANRYCNAFWNGVQMTYGDGDGTSCLPLSGGLDVVGHELTHGVTEFTSNLIYENQSGALNESFSDMMGNTIEFYAAQNRRDPAGSPDWLIGEDVIKAPDIVLAFRNMGDPQEDADPDHFSEFIVTTADNGGVHSNSGIPNHAYYLAVNGGKNVGCGGSLSGHTHTADCDVTVPAIGLDRAAQVFYDGFTSLPEFANFCDARNSPVAVAGSSRAAVSAAWAAVGVHSGCTPATPPPPPCLSDPDATVPFGSPHPYGNNGDCTWTYDNGTGGFAFHFSLLDTEKNFDFVIVSDGAGNELARYTGQDRNGATSPCITTPTGSVRLVTDQSVVAQGFTVDAVVAC
ncbi:Zn-dependent metalloprotease [Kribbella orskensis]|uniref:Neutral metalloproteinase n=1 Tax=Kribbella orskensis TaxID=2512216 RepID=A0ABY2BI71_9ACTN|nr:MULTISPECIES: M4 family metallopeptidase [Kribbella]TCN38253.1 Zn-dependent metalloprotease [Kribbella sp. VKM Ac-2500]TCO20217.1 Zn-dependent metalloprotease [Kribbella orskensis]